MQICWNFLLKKMWVAFAVQKLLTFFQQKNIRILYIESAKTVNEMTLNKLVKLKALWTIRPCYFKVQSTLVISNSKGLSEILRDIRTSTYQICRIEENII